MITERIADIVSQRGVSTAKIAEVTGISPQILYNCFDQKKKRELKADELILVCRFLNINPLDLSATNTSA